MVLFRVVPVVDLKGGLAVHAVRGQRDRYQPVECPWCTSGDALALIKGYKELFGLQDLYVADLDAIIHGQLQRGLHASILNAIPGKVMVDCGIRDLPEFNVVHPSRFHEVILGTESVQELNQFGAIIDANENETIISLDLMGEKVLSPVGELASKSPTEAFDFLSRFEPDAFIVLDLAGVGAKRGVNPVAKEMAARGTFPVLLGGGIKRKEDLEAAMDAGLAGVLVATALQEGLLGPGELRAFLQEKGREKGMDPPIS